MGKLNVVDGKVIKDKKIYKDVSKKNPDNNDDNEFSTGFKEFSVESKFDPIANQASGSSSSSNKSHGSSITEAAIAWKEQKLSQFEDRFMNKIPQVGDMIERAGEVIQDFGKLVYDFGNRIEHFKRTVEKNSSDSESSSPKH